MNTSKISMVCDSYVSLEDAMVQNYIADNYSFPIVNLSVKEEMIEECLGDIKKSFSSVNLDDIELNKTNRFLYLEDKGKFFMEFALESKNKAYTVNIYATSYGLAKSVYEAIRQYESGGNGIFIEVDNYIIAENGALNVRKNFKEIGDLFSASPKYYPYLDTDVLFKKFTISSENILLLVGQPGVGKTKLVSLYERFMFSHPELFNSNKDTLSDEVFFKIAYVKNEEILAKDTFWEELNKNNYNLIFLDDADNCLLPRDSEVYTTEDANRKKFISQLLSFTDGIGENNTKIIITTNRSVDNIDVAVLRRGRTFDILEMQTLSFQEGLDIWLENDLLEEEYNEMFKDKHDIIPSELGAEISLKVKLRESDEEIGDYLLRDGVSLIHSYRNRKNKISF